MGTEMRKKEHLKIAAERNVSYKTKTTGLEDVELVYKCLPELEKEDVDIKTQFLGHEFNAPLMVSGMTGGTEKAEQINKDIAKACEELGIGFGLGSQRAMLENRNLSESYKVRDVAPSIFLAGNIGAVQLKEYELGELERMLEEVGADALAIHLNAAQEAIQPEGSTDFSGVVKKIEEVAAGLSKPVYIKGVGHGISGEVAKMLSKTKVKAIDVQGAGGTSWIGIESMRSKSAIGETFWDFGIPTAVSIVECRKNFFGEIIASGGIEHGLDVVKGLMLGADIAAIARPVLIAQEKEGFEGARKFLERVIDEIRTSLFLIGAKKLEEAKKKKFVVVGKTRDWIESLQ